MVVRAGTRRVQALATLGDNHYTTLAGAFCDWPEGITQLSLGILSQIKRTKATEAAFFVRTSQDVNRCRRLLIHTNRLMRYMSLYWLQ